MPLWSEELEEVLTETFRRLVLDALVREDRLSENFRERLLTFRHGGGFSVYGRHLILNEEPARLAHMARYIVRPPVAADRTHQTNDGRVLLDIPPDPKTGDRQLVLDPLEWIRRVTNQIPAPRSHQGVTNQIPAPRSHQVRYYGAYANKVRQGYRDEAGEVRVRQLAEEDEPPLPKSRASWARLLRLVFEVDPLTCTQCGAQMRVIAVITQPALIDQLLRHVEKAAEAPFGARAPPAA